MADTPSYWSIDPSTYDTWVRVLGAAAAGKLMAACCGYFFHGADPDDFKLNKTARALFDGERDRLDRRRVSALNGAKSGRGIRAAQDGIRAAESDLKAEHMASDSVENQTATSVEKSASCEKSAGESAKSLRKVAGKSTKNQASAQPVTCENANSRLAPIITMSPNNNPQTPAPRDGRARGSGMVSRAEYDAMLASGLGYASPGAYGMGERSCIVAGG